MKTFLTISRQECQSAYLDILNNSNQRWDSGEKLAEISDFGGAISMAIISVEELVKAMIVFLDGKGFDFRNVRGMNTFFKSHQIRYVIAFAMLVMSIIGDELMKFIKKVKSNPGEFIQLTDKIKQDDNYFEKNFKYYFFRKLIVLRREFKWFSKADVFRQDGFYCDYQDQLKTPILISKKEYRQVIQRLERVRTIGIAIIDACNTDEEFYESYLEEMKADFKSKGYYDNMADALDNVKATKGNPFELIMRSFKKI